MPAMLHRRKQRHQQKAGHPPLPPSPPQHENVRQFLFKTCSVKSVVEKGPIYNSGLDSYFSKVRNPARSGFYLSEILILQVLDSLI